MPSGGGTGLRLGRRTAGTRLHPPPPGISRTFPPFSVQVRHLGALASVTSTLARPTPGNCEDGDPFVVRSGPLLWLELA